MKRNIVYWLSMAVLLMASAVLAACAQGSPQQSQVSGGTITRAITSEPTSLDPHGPAGSGQNVILPYLFDTLVYRDVDNSYKPYLADSWEEKEGGKIVEFKLHHGVVFHDGSALDAQAVQFTFQRLMEQGAKSPLASGFADVQQIETEGEDLVRLVLKQPSSTLFSTLSSPYAGIISPKAVQEAEDQFGVKPVGSGAFKLEAWQPGTAIILARNPAYAWGPVVLANRNAPRLDKLIFKIVPDASAQLTAFQTGEVDVLFVNQPSQIARFSKDPAAKMVETTLNSLIYLGFNCKAPPLDDLNIRQAIAHAIDKQKLVQVALGGIGEAAFSPLASTLPGFDAALKSNELGFDLQKTAELLKQSGYKRQENGAWVSGDGEAARPLSFDLLISTRAPNEALATVIQEQLKNAGIQVNIRALESAAASEAATKGEYQMMLWRYDWNDADVLMIYLSTDRIGRTNRSFYSNPELDALLVQAAHEVDQQTRNQLYSQAQKILMAEVPWVPLYTPKDYIVLRNTIQGVVVGPMGRLLLNEATLQK